MILHCKNCYTSWNLCSKMSKMWSIFLRYTVEFAPWPISLYIILNASNFISNLVYGCNMGPFICSWGQWSHIKVKVHLRSSRMIAWKCTIWLICILGDQLESCEPRRCGNGSRSGVNLHHPQTSTAGDTSGRGDCDVFYSHLHQNYTPMHTFLKVKIHDTVWYMMWPIAGSCVVMPRDCKWGWIWYQNISTHLLFQNYVVNFVLGVPFL